MRHHGLAPATMRAAPGATLFAAQLQGAKLNNAQLLGAFLYGAQLQGASLIGAQLQGVSLIDAQLQGAKLDGAQLGRASLIDAQLQGASLDGAQLLGASLYGAQLQGASLDYAQLQGASLIGAHLQGASLDGAQLQGASLDYAQLQGASLDGAQLQGASLVNVFAWRTDARKAVWEDTRVINPETGPKYFGCNKKGKPSTCDWSPQSFNALKEMIAKEVPDGALRTAAMARIEQSLDPTKAQEGADEMAKLWKARASSFPARETYEKHLAGIWQEKSCAAHGEPYVLGWVLSQTGGFPGFPFNEQSTQPREAAAMARSTAPPRRSLRRE
jgi:hypothetical protein